MTLSSDASLPVQSPAVRVPNAPADLVVRALQALAGASVVVFVPIDTDASRVPASYAALEGTAPEVITGLENTVGAWLEQAEEGVGEKSVAIADRQWRVVVGEGRSGSGRRSGALAMARPVEGTTSWSDEDIAALQTLADLCHRGESSGEVGSAGRTQLRLDALVTSIAVELMSVSANELSDALEWVLRSLTEFFEVDTSFLRGNDFDRGMTILVAEWPKRENVPVPDPIGEVPFGSDPVFDSTRDLKVPFVMRPDSSPDAYQDRIQEGSGIPQVSIAMVPLLRTTTVGVLGFVKFGDRPWETAETNALQAVASLLVQLQARVDAEERLQYQAYHDQLTSLPNRRALLEELDRRLSGDDGRSTAVLFLDLDRFKAMNDFLGHAGGDRLLVTIGDRLRGAMRTGDFVARLAGDEFVFLIDGPTGELEALAIAERLLGLVAAGVVIGGHHLSRTASLGISLGRALPGTDRDLLGQADAALHLAKARGGNQVIVFDEDLRASTKQRSDTELQLRYAIDHDELRLHYQPEIDMRTGQLLAVEALVRWQHPERGLLAAGTFIEIAEETGLVVDLGRWVMIEACRQMARWRQQYPQLRFVMRVNMSPAQLGTRHLVRLVADSLEQNGLPGRVLCIEITEHAVMQGIEQALMVLHELKALGISLAIDDFGTGYSSMAQLKRLPVDALKVDQTFVAGLGVDGGDRAIVDATVRLAQAFGLEVVAEGVETSELVGELLNLGCYRAQGYLLSRPKAAEDLEEILIRGGIEPSTFHPRPALVADPQRGGHRGSPGTLHQPNGWDEGSLRGAGATSRHP